MTDSIITYFPQAFYVAENLLELGYLKELQDKVYRIKDGHPSGGSNWVLRPYNTLDTYELINDPTFNTLLNKLIFVLVERFLFEEKDKKEFKLH